MATNNKRKPQESFRKYDPYSFLKNPSYTDLDPNGRYFETISGIFAEALSSAGLNIADAQEANMFYYNKSGRKELLDPASVGKTYIFFTRPDLNWCYPNISSSPDVEYLFNTRVGRQVMAMLTTPSRIVGGAMNTNRIDGDQAANKAGDNAYEKAIKAHKDKIEAAKKIKEKMKDSNDVNSDAMIKDEETLKALGLLEEEVEFPELGEEKVVASYWHSMKSWDKEGDFGFRAKHPPGTEFVNPAYRNKGNNMGLMHFTSCFIPLLGNMCVEAPAGRDLAIETIESAKDYFGNSLIYATDCDEINAPTEITFSFENPANNSVWLMFYLWLTYIRKVARGKFFPRMANVKFRKIDYTCSFFVFVTERDGITLKAWSRGMGCFPVNLAMQGISHSKEPNTDAWRNISVPFKVNKYRVMDPQDLMDFNFLAGKEWKRKNKAGFGEQDAYFSRSDMVKKTRILEKDMFEKVDRNSRGMSGCLPPGMLNNHGLFNGIGNRTYQYNNTWGGYPYIVDGNKLVWVHPDEFDTAYGPQVARNERTRI